MGKVFVLFCFDLIFFLNYNLNNKSQKLKTLHPLIHKICTLLHSGVFCGFVVLIVPLDKL